jgi:large subunit ribosomal protein L21
MYAIIRTGGKQAKVREGDVIDVERLRAEGEVTFTPLLFVGDDGTVISDREGLKKVRVVGRIVGGSTGPKVDIFKYKAKTGYRRRQGHRQKYTTVEVTAIEAPGTKPAAKAKAEPAAEEPAAPAGTAAEKAPASEPAAATATTTKPAAAKAKTTKSTTTEKASPGGKAASEEPAKPSAKRSSKSTSTTKKSTSTTKKSTTTTKKTSTAKKPASKKES